MKRSAYHVENNLMYPIITVLRIDFKFFYEQFCMHFDWSYCVYMHFVYFFLFCYVPHRREGGHIVFGADPVGLGVSVGVSMTLSCLHDIS